MRRGTDSKVASRNIRIVIWNTSDNNFHRDATLKPHLDSLKLSELSGFVADNLYAILIVHKKCCYISQKH
jgi:hypothetical protein